MILKALDTHTPNIYVYVRARVYVVQKPRKQNRKPLTNAHIIYFSFVVLRIESGASHMVNMLYTTELHLQLQGILNHVHK